MRLSAAASVEAPTDIVAIFLGIRNIATRPLIHQNHGDADIDCC